MTAVDVAGNSVAITRNSLKSNDQVLVGLLPATGEAIGELRALTPAAGEVLKDVSFGDYEQFEFKGWNNDTVHGYVVKPHNYQEGKSYPVAFLIHGTRRAASAMAGATAGTRRPTRARATRW